MPETNTLVPVLMLDGRVPLGQVASEDAARIVRRIVDNESLAPKLGVAAFNSAS